VRLVTFIIRIYHDARSPERQIFPVVYKKTPFVLQPEDGFIQKPKHVANIF